MSYQCPLCQQPLLLQNGCYQCDKNHQFDLAKEGYVNLMPANHKRSKNPGDNKEMMQARRRFLEAGHYSPLAVKVAELCQQFLSGTPQRLLDIGCGEGYYTSQVQQTLAAAGPDCRVYGLDISKVAVRYAAKRYPDCHFSVASSHRLPFADHSLDAILRIYAPCKADELHRCTAEHGIIVTVTPAARHLYQLREKIYTEVRLHDEAPEEVPGFTLSHQEKLHYPMTTAGQATVDLLQMTPFAWKATEELKQALLADPAFHCEADFLIRVYRKQ
jgi:23S rRNA (guanine745-N1)-methyltransferase